MFERNLQQHLAGFFCGRFNRNSEWWYVVLYVKRDWNPMGKSIRQIQLFQYQKVMHIQLPFLMFFAHESGLRMKL